jgi:hypothetical protein
MGFDAEQVEPMGDFSPLPAGQYLAMAVASGWEATKNERGEFIKFTFEIIDGEHRGRSLFARLNLKNENAQAVRMARSELSSICRAVGVLRPKNSEELHNKPVVLSVEIEERKDKPGRFSNQIKGYASPSAQAAPAPTQAPMQTQQPMPAPAPTQPAASNPALPPWRR